MDLHTAKQPDWANLDRDDMNRWQRIADKTDGWLTPANCISATGTVMVVGGLIEIAKGNYPVGLGLVAVGRSLDVVDGHVAQKTGTKSPKGELVDAGVDKIQAAAALSILWSQGMIEDLPALSFATLNAANLVLTGIAKVRGAEIHPSQEGKLFTGAMWGSIVASIGAHALHTHDPGTLYEVVNSAAYGLATGATIYGVMAAKDYTRDAFAPVQVK